MNKFIRDLIERGEAARRNPDGSLPEGATHEIIGEDEHGEPIVVRRRMSSPPKVGRMKTNEEE